MGSNQSDLPSPSRRCWGPIGFACAAAARSAAAWCIYGFSRPFTRGLFRGFGDLRCWRC